MELGATTVRNMQGAGAQASVNSVRTHDVDEQAALLAGWGQSYSQMSAGEFSGAISEVRLPGIHLFLEETGNALYQLGKLPHGLGAYGVPIRLDGRATFCGSLCQGSHLHVFSGDDRFEFYSPRGLVMAGFVLPNERVMQAFSSSERELVSQTLSDPHLRKTTAAHVDGLRHLIAGVFDVLRGSPQLIDNAAVVEALGSAIVSNLAQAILDDRGADDVRMSDQRRWQLVRAMRDMAYASPDRPLTVADICSEAGVSRRALQYAVQESLGLSPVEFLRIVRLNGARRAMKSVNSVTEAATLWGFWHFGRFAHDYRSLFGELPSETFQRWAHFKKEQKAPLVRRPCLCSAAQLDLVPAAPEDLPRGPA